MYIATTRIRERGKLLLEHLRQIGEERFSVAVNRSISSEIIETEEMHGRGRRQRNLAAVTLNAPCRKINSSTVRLSLRDFRVRVRSGKFDFAAGIIWNLKRGHPDFLNPFQALGEAPPQYEPRRNSPSVTTCKPFCSCNATGIVDAPIPYCGRESIISDLASGMLAEGLSQSGRAQQAADMLGAERRTALDARKHAFPEQFSRYNHDVADRKQRGKSVRKAIMRDNNWRAAASRSHWLETLDRHMQDRDVPGSANYWSPRLDTASRDEITAIQDAKVAAVVPFLFENSGFYRHRFERLGLIPDDIKCVADLIAKWPVVEKTEMAIDAAEHPPYGTYTTIDDTIWAERGWMMFASSGSTGVPRVFRYSHVDREMGAWANARALHSMDFRHGDTVFMVTGYGPHVWAWGVQYALEKMRLPVIPGGGMDARARANIVQSFKPTILLLTPSYALHLGPNHAKHGWQTSRGKLSTDAVRGRGRAVFGLRAVAATRELIQDLWGARMVEFYGCTEASPHVGGFSPARLRSRRKGRSRRISWRMCRCGKSSMPRAKHHNPTASAASRSVRI